MAITKQITELDTYKKYLSEVGEVPSYHLDKCFACGLPAAWLYLRAIGLEEFYFDLLTKVKDRSGWFKHLFYIVLLANKNNPFFPHIPDNILDLQIPAEVAAAQIDMPRPEFQMAYAFTPDQLKRTLETVSSPGKLINLGDKRKSIAIMCNDDGSYAVYHQDNPSALHFKTAERCVDLVMRIMYA